MADKVLVELLYQLADDELVIGHRISEWLGLAPHLEEDIAFGSIAQDEVGHAAMFYRLLEELGEGKADDLAFLRPAAERKNAVLLERPNGQGTYLADPRFDWGYAVARLLAYDVFDSARLEVLTRSSCLPLAQAAAKVRREERYHLLHHVTWFKRLAAGSDRARGRLEAGIHQAWQDVGGLFTLGAVPTGDVFPATTQDLVDRWTAELKPLFDSCGLAWPTGMLMRPPLGLDGRRGQHTPELTALLETMSEVCRAVPGAQW
ncbi:MAG TPA: 1,2-phenylacetyl-CoA epoxidase subunit PaaC [Symbiobacteriaceae bacterium]|nr:1,2-phenylacetyl-CoA epoxidase subunit PaaC [Symbiobacteriaceae bacterium]